MTLPLPALTWRELMASQSGVLARWQALAAGLTGRAWQRRISTDGPWQTPFPGVAVDHRGCVSREQQVWAAVLYGGRGAAASGELALWHVAGKGDPPARFDVALPERSQRAAHGLFVPHRCSGLSAIVHPVREPPQVRVAPAVLHAAAWAATDRTAEWKVAAAVQQRLVRVGDVRTAFDGMPRLRRRALVSAVLDDVELGAHARTELDLLGLLRRNRLPLPDRMQLQVRARGLRYLDAWWEKQRVAGEVDGAHHRFVGTWDADVLRANDVQVSQRHDRVVLLRFTGGNLRHDEPQVVDQLRAVLL